MNQMAPEQQLADEQQTIIEMINIENKDQEEWEALRLQMEEQVAAEREAAEQ